MQYSNTMASSGEIRLIIKGLVERLLAEYSPSKVILFGSHAYGNPGPHSDIDLLIIKDTTERFIDRWVTVRRILSDPGRRVPIETIVLTPGEVAARLAAGDQFVKEIMTRGEVLHDA